MQTHYLYFTGS